MDAMDSEAPTRAVERDIERTRNEMDATLSKLERRLAPSEIVHQGAESMRARARGLAEGMIATLKRHPVPVALLVGLALRGYARRPNAEDRLRMRADEDLERAWRVLQTGLARAKDRGSASEAAFERRLREVAGEARAYVAPALDAVEELALRSGADAWRVLQQLADRSRNTRVALRAASSAHPLATIALVGLAAAVGARRMRSTSRA